MVGRSLRRNLHAESASSEQQRSHQTLQGRHLEEQREGFVLTVWLSKMPRLGTGGDLNDSPEFILRKERKKN